MLALTHHFIVQFCAFQVYHQKVLFQDYLILGDDLLILDPKVAKMYLSVMKQLDVGVNLSKSLISTCGVGEFAKQLISPVGTLHGLSLKEFLKLGDSISNVVALCHKLDLKLSLVMRLFGYGSKSVGHQPKPFYSLSLRAILDHLFMSPLAKAEGDWVT